MMPARARFVGAAVVSAAATALSGCGGTTGGVLLVDGSLAPTRPAQLKSASASVARTRAVTIPAGPSRVGACLRRFVTRASTRSELEAVERVGVVGASLTLGRPGDHLVFACDRTAVRGERGSVWCGGSAGVRVAGRLRDPRLSLGCFTSRGDPVGFAWVDPHPGTRWIIVDDGSSAEIYGALGWLPIRVTTRNVDLARSSATFDVTEYGARGDVMARYGVVARVAG